MREVFEAQKRNYFWIRYECSMKIRVFEPKNISKDTIEMRSRAINKSWFSVCI